MSSASEEICLIVNADDYGYFDCVSRGILESVSQGIVTATGILANADRFELHAAWLRGDKTVDLGLHLNLTDGKPLTQDMRNRLCRWGGRFPAKFVVAGAVVSGMIPVHDVELEWRAQIERCLGKDLTLRFLNSHEHIHMLPSLFRLVQSLAREYEIAHVRFSSSELFSDWTLGPLVRDALMKTLAMLNRRHIANPAAVLLGMGVSGRLSTRYLRRVLPTLRPGCVYELMCHPGRYDDTEVADPRLISYHDWEGELAMLTSTEVRMLLDDHGVRLIRYRDLETRMGRLIVGERTA